MAKRVTPAKPVAKAKPPRADFEHVRVRKIRNGHVTTHMGMKDGKFFKTETYSRKAPTVTAEKPKAAASPTRRPRTDGLIGRVSI
jgi:hypothetical protein